VGQRVSFLVLFALTITNKEKSTPLKSRSLPAGVFFCCFALAPLSKEKQFARRAYYKLEKLFC
jgi:hypothetical protein